MLTPLRRMGQHTPVVAHQVESDTLCEPSQSLENAMSDWVDILAETIFRATELLTGSDRPKRIIGITFAAITIFTILGTLIAIYIGTELPPVGYYILVPALLLSSAISVYCFATDQ
jgi:hypothetical protein